MILIIVDFWYIIFTKRCLVQVCYNFLNVALISRWERDQMMQRLLLFMSRKSYPILLNSLQHQRSYIEWVSRRLRVFFNGEKRPLIDRSSDDSAEKINRGRRSYNSCGMKFAKQQDSEWPHRAELELVLVVHANSSSIKLRTHRCTGSPRDQCLDAPRYASLFRSLKLHWENTEIQTTSEKKVKKFFRNYSGLEIWVTTFTRFEMVWGFY